MLCDGEAGARPGATGAGAGGGWGAGGAGDAGGGGATAAAALAAGRGGSGRSGIALAVTLANGVPAGDGAGFGISVNSMLNTSFGEPGEWVAGIGAFTSRNSGREPSCCMSAAAFVVKPLMLTLFP